ncbi:MAG: TIR domain-containing protein [Bryobacteraceae bacterium]|nr:TIR domain-containing protein [Bryobacteraceae bacterium]
MDPANPAINSALREVALVVRKCLQEGFPVEIEGLGTFRLNRAGGIEFLAETRQKVFIAYAEEDYATAEKLYLALEAQDFDPWLDKKKLMPGQNWPRSIERAIGISDFFIACLSSRGVGKRGFFQSELRYALDCASRMPLEEIFLIPVRLDPCPVPGQIAQEIQYVDLFPDFDAGLHRILAVMRQAGKQRRKKVA